MSCKRLGEPDETQRKRVASTTDEPDVASSVPSTIDEPDVASSVLEHDDDGLPFVRCSPPLAPTARIYHFAQQTDPWFRMRVGKVTATAATTMAGLNRYEHAWDHANVWLGTATKESDASGADVMGYGNTYEDRNRTLFEHVMGVAVLEGGFVVDDMQPRRGISPDGFVEPLHVEMVRGIDGAMERVDMGMTLFEAKCSPYSLPGVFKVSYVGQVHAQMAVTGLRWCWASLWHQDKLRIMLVEFSHDLWAWMDLRIRTFLALCDRWGPLEASARIRQHALWSPTDAQAIEADWYPSRWDDQRFASRNAGTVLDSVPVAERGRWLHDIGYDPASMPACVLNRLAPRPIVHQVYEKLDTPLDTTTRTERGYVARDAWPTQPPNLADFRRIVNTSPLDDTSPYSDAAPTSARHAVIRACRRTEPLPDAIVAHQQVYAK